MSLLFAAASANAADIAISALPAATTVSGSDIVPIVQSGTTKKATFTVQQSLWDSLYQPLDGDLTALSALTGTHNIYYRSAANTWTSVTIGSGLDFTGATLSATGGVPTSRTLTIAGVAFDLSANRAWTTSTILDGLTSAAQGDILYRGASNWVYLTPGTDGNILTTHGASANPTWSPPPASGAPTDAHYLTNQSESGLSAEINLGALSTGMLKGTVSGSVSTISAVADTIVGDAFITLANPSAVTFPRINADNSVSALDAATFRSAIGAGTGGGDFSSNTSTSVDGEIVLFNGTSGKSGKRATGTGLAKITSGVLSTASSGTDYAPATSGSVPLKGNGSGGFSSAVAADIVGLFSACSGTQYLGADGSCHTPASTTLTHAATFVVDGHGTILASNTFAYVKIPYGGTLQGWTLIGSPSGSITVDIFRAADGAGLPVTSIIGGSGVKPALSSAVENSSTSFTSWTSTTLTAKDNLAVSISSISNVTYMALTIYYQ